ILYIRVAALENEEQWRRDELLTIIATRQYVDWHKIRHRDVASTEVAEKIEAFCRNIFDALHQPLSAPVQNHAKYAARAGPSPRADRAEAAQRAEAPCVDDAVDARTRGEEKPRRREAPEELPKVEHSSDREPIKSDAEKRLRPSWESVLLGAGVGGAV